MYMVKQKERMPVIHELVRRNLDASAGMQQRGQIQGGLKMREFTVGQKVWWYYPHLPIKSSNIRGLALMKSWKWLATEMLRALRDKEEILGSTPHH